MSSEVLLIRSWSRGPSPGWEVRPTTPGSSVARAASSTAPRSRAGSPYWWATCRPSQIAPLSRTSAGDAIGSRVHRRTSRSVLGTVSGTVAAGTSSRSAITSHSPGIPSNGRLTKTGVAPPAAPWHAL